MSTKPGQAQLPQRSRAAVAVFDVSGRLVQRLVDGDLPAGTHRLSWTARATGMYFVELAVDGKRIGRKLVIRR